MPGLFIDVKVQPEIAKNAEIAAKLEEVCPVGIFVASPGGVEIDEQNLDECVLCDLCIEAAPENAVQVIKLYQA